MAAKPDSTQTGVPNGCQTHIIRIMKDFREFYQEDSKEMFIVPEENDITVVHALIIGPEKTPYHNGFFYFVLRYPTDYPIRPPHVKLITTGGRTVRFNPNLYVDGKVCLSILGTWQGPAWSAAQTLFTTLLSIQTLMNEKPYHNEPGYEEGKPHRFSRNLDVNQAVNNYNEMITHETVRVAVLQMLEETSTDARNMPPALKNIMISHFKTNYQFYEDLIRSKEKLDGQTITDPFGDPQRPKTYQYKQLLDKLLKTRDKLCDIKPEADRTPPSLESEGAAAAAQPPPDPLIEPYNEIAAKMLSSVVESKPQEKTNTNIDNWDDLIDDMNAELNEDSLDAYISGSEEEEQVEEQME